MNGLISKRARVFFLCLIIIMVSFTGACSQAKESATPEPETPSLPSQDIKEVQHYTYRIINTYPHDPKAFTEGLAFEDGFFYEGSGRRGRSTLRQVVPETGEVLKSYRLPNQYFGEGITLYHDRILQLTWQSNMGFIYDKDSFEPVGSFSYPTEGWGITHDGEHLIMSDGSATLHFLDTETFTELHRIEVLDEGVPVTKLNELEYIEGKVYANVWLTDKIVIITPETGEASGWIDLEGLLNLEDYTEEVDVLNGIAYDGETGRLFVTGKLWPQLFGIELVPEED